MVKPLFKPTDPFSAFYQKHFLEPFEDTRSVITANNLCVRGVTNLAVIGVFKRHFNVMDPVGDFVFRTTRMSNRVFGPTIHAPATLYIDLGPDKSFTMQFYVEQVGEHTAEKDERSWKYYSFGEDHSFSDGMATRMIHKEIPEDFIQFLTDYLAENFPMP